MCWLCFFVMSKNDDYIILYHHVINDGLGISDVQTNPFLSGMDISELIRKIILSVILIATLFYQRVGWTGCWFGTWIFMTFHILGIIIPNWRTHIFWRGRYTTNQVKSPESKNHYYVMIFPVYPHHTLKMFLKVFLCYPLHDIRQELVFLKASHGQWRSRCDRQLENSKTSDVFLPVYVRHLVPSLPDTSFTIDIIYICSFIV